MRLYVTLQAKSGPVESLVVPASAEDSVADLLLAIEQRAKSWPHCENYAVKTLRLGSADGAMVCAMDQVGSVLRAEDHIYAEVENVALHFALFSPVRPSCAETSGMSMSTIDKYFGKFDEAKSVDEVECSRVSVSAPEPTSGTNNSWFGSQDVDQPSVVEQSIQQSLGVQIEIACTDTQATCLSQFVSSYASQSAPVASCDTSKMLKCPTEQPEACAVVASVASPNRQRKVSTRVNGGEAECERRRRRSCGAAPGKSFCEERPQKEFVERPRRRSDVGMWMMQRSFLLDDLGVSFHEEVNGGLRLSGLGLP